LLRKEQLLIRNDPFCALLLFEMAVLTTEISVVAITAERIKAVVELGWILFLCF